MRIKVARIFNTYGPRMHPNDGRVVSNFIVQALQGEPITIYGDGSQTRSFCYVDDLIDGLHTPHGQRRRASPGRSMSAIPARSPIRDARRADYRFDRLALARSSIGELPEDDPLQRCPDITQAKRTLRWEPRVPLDQGLRRTIAYFHEMLSEAGFGFIARSYANS